MSRAIIFSLITVCVSASTVGLLAYFSGRRGSVAFFLIALAALWLGVSLGFGYSASVNSLIPGRITAWRHVLATFFGIAPLVCVPALLTFAAVSGKASLRAIPWRALVGAVLALPMSFMTLLVSTCAITHNCP